MNQSRPSVVAVILKTIVTHSVTYFILGLIFLNVFDYGHLFLETQLRHFMRPVSDPLVMAGGLFQPIRGVLFGIVFYLLRDTLFGRKNGWLYMWIMLVCLGILSTFGPSPGSIEGMIYTVLPLGIHLIGLPEVLVQALVLSAILCYWVDHPEKKWLTWLMGGLFFIFMLLPVLGLIYGPQA